MINAAISLEVEDAEMVARISGRYTCAGCGEGFHDQFKKPAVEGECDKCGKSEFNRRADDNAETVASRLAAYHEQTAPLIAYYQAQGSLKTVDAMRQIPEIANDLESIAYAAMS